MELKTTYESDAIHKSWVEVYRKHPGMDRLNERLIDRMLEVVKPAPDALFLDAGCGSGKHLLEIARRGYRCIGVDISESVLRTAEAAIADRGLQSLASIRCQSLEHLDFEPDAFDVVHC